MVTASGSNSTPGRWRDGSQPARRFACLVGREVRRCVELVVQKSAELGRDVIPLSPREKSHRVIDVRFDHVTCVHFLVSFLLLAIKRFTVEESSDQLALRLW